MKIISVGEVLWDVIAETEHLGGAPFNFAAHAGKLGHEVFFVSAVGSDERGERVLQRMQAMHLSTRYVARVPEYATGWVTVQVDSAGQPSFLIHRPAAYDFPRLTAGDLKSLLSSSPDLIYFGTLQQMSPPARGLTMRLLHATPQARRFYDVNLRTGSYEPELVRELMGRATILKVNDEEVEEIARLFGEHYSSLEDFARRSSETFGLEAVCVTRGAQGCSLLLGGQYVEAKGYPAAIVDAVGAGDAFAAAFVHGLSQNWAATSIADFANRVGALVASRPGAIPPWTVEEASALTQQPISTVEPRTSRL
jgi:fructokinase